MKPLICILLATITAEAQSLADVARTERARQAQVSSSRVISMDNSGSTAAIATAPAAATPAAVGAGPAKAPAASAAATAAPVLDPAKKFADDVAKVRLRIRELQDQESALLLQINDFNLEFFAPVSDAGTKEAAQVKIRDAQQKLATARQELVTARTQLQQMEAQGPATK